MGLNTPAALSNALNDNDSQQNRAYFESGSTPPSQIETVFSNLSHHEHIWVTPVGGRDKWEITPQVSPTDADGWEVDWYKVWNRVTNATSGNFLSHWLPETLKFFAQRSIPNLPEVHLIPAKRTLGLTGENFEDLSGRGLIDHLATLQNPAWDKQEDREKFTRITNFLRTVTSKSDANLEIPSGREHLLVHMDNKVLPLASLGSGIHEVVLIAAFCTIYDHSIMCVEEPEIHLHPLLQRKLINYLKENTSSQYFIATHSSAFIDTPDSNVFHVSNDGEQTRIRPAITGDDRRNILDDLGYLASDLLQANSVIWVEGPSDRTYLNHWISALDERLKEGIHYTLMFYGGSLISHLSASDDVMNDFIALRKLNGHMAIVLDSDKASDSDGLKPHAQRIVDEMSEGSGVVWVTSGREVENYVDGKKLQSALERLHPRIYKKAGKTKQYDHAFYFYREGPKKGGRNLLFKGGDKVGAANIICSEEANLNILDLRERVTEIVDMIVSANDI